MEPLEQGRQQEGVGGAGGVGGVAGESGTSGAKVSSSLILGGSSSAIGVGAAGGSLVLELLLQGQGAEVEQHLLHPQMRVRRVAKSAEDSSVESSGSGLSLEAGVVSSSGSEDSSSEIEGTGGNSGVIGAGVSASSPKRWKWRKNC